MFRVQFCSKYPLTLLSTSFFLNIIPHLEQCYQNQLWQRHVGDCGQSCSQPPQHSSGNAGFPLLPIADTLDVMEWRQGIDMVEITLQNAKNVQRMLSYLLPLSRGGRSLRSMQPDPDLRPKTLTFKKAWKQSLVNATWPRPKAKNPNF